jgi:hypothetical protein
MAPTTGVRGHIVSQNRRSQCTLDSTVDFWTEPILWSLLFAIYTV